MKFDKYFFRRIEKWWRTKVIAFAYKDLPFEIAWCVYEPSVLPDYSIFKDKKILGEFVMPKIKRHYVFYETRRNNRTS